MSRLTNRLEKDRKAVEKAIHALIEADPHLMSVPGIGTATATEIVIATNEMKTITDPKKMAASAVRLSCGGCPF